MQRRFGSVIAAFETSRGQKIALIANSNFRHRLLSARSIATPRTSVSFVVFNGLQMTLPPHLVTAGGAFSVLQSTTYRVLSGPSPSPMYAAVA